VNNRGPASMGPLSGLTVGDPDAPGVTLQLFIDQFCTVNISTADTLNTPINGGCTPMPGGSTNVYCNVDNSGVTTFDLGIWVTDGCMGTAMNSIHAAGKGKCLPTQLVSNGQPAPIPLYSTVICNTKLVDAQTPTQDSPIAPMDAPTPPSRFTPRSVMSHHPMMQFTRTVFAKIARMAQGTQ